MVECEICGAQLNCGPGMSSKEKAQRKAQGKPLYNDYNMHLVAVHGPHHGVTISQYKDLTPEQQEKKVKEAAAEILKRRKQELEKWRRF